MYIHVEALLIFENCSRKYDGCRGQICVRQFPCHPRELVDNCLKKVMMFFMISYI